MDFELYYQAKRTCVIWLPELGCLKIEGADHLDLLHRITTNDVRNLQSGNGQVTLFCSELGRIVARAILLRFDSYVLLVTELSMVSELAAWIEKFIFIEEVRVEDVTASTKGLTLIGPEAANSVTDRFGGDISLLCDWQHIHFFHNDAAVFVVRTVEFDMDGFLILSSKEAIAELQEELDVEGIPNIDKDIYNILRIESGWPYADIDYSNNYNPHETAMLPYVDFKKGCYIGQEVIARLDTYEKVKNCLVRISIDDTKQPDPESIVVFGNERIGTVTSSAYSPDSEKVLALALLRKKAVEIGKQVTVQSENNTFTAHIEAEL